MRILYPQDRFWRKNMRPADQGTGCLGVDINRNYDFFWGRKFNPMFAFLVFALHIRLEAVPNYFYFSGCSLGVSNCVPTKSVWIQFMSSHWSSLQGCQEKKDTKQKRFFPFLLPTLNMQTVTFQSTHQAFAPRRHSTVPQLHRSPKRKWCRTRRTRWMSWCGSPTTRLCPPGCSRTGTESTASVKFPTTMTTKWYVKLQASFLVSKYWGGVTHENTR